MLDYYLAANRALNVWMSKKFLGVLILNCCVVAVGDRLIWVWAEVDYYSSDLLTAARLLVILTEAAEVFFEAD